MTVTLTNRSGRIKVFTLPHESYCQASGHCACVMTPGRSARRIASSLTLAAGIELEGLHPAVLEAPDVARAIRSGDVGVERKAPAPASALPRDALAHPEPAGPRRAKRSRGER